jgi:hypothetical protein
MAENFDKYMFHKLRFVFRSGNPTTASGRIYACIDGDPDDSPPSGISQLTNMAYSKTSGVYSDLVIDHPYVNKKLFVSNSFKHNGVEFRTMYNGFLFAATQCDVSNVWDLWVEYDVEFTQPQVPSEEVLEDTIGDDITFGSGTDEAFFPMFSTGNSSLPVVNSGIAGVPVFTVNSQNVTQAIDVERIPRSTLHIANSISGTAGLTPLQVCPYTYMASAVFDRVGTLLGNPLYDDHSLTLGGGATQVTHAAVGQGDWSIAGRNLLATGLIDVAARVFDAFPTAKYLVPYMVVRANGLSGTTGTRNMFRLVN